MTIGILTTLEDDTNLRQQEGAALVRSIDQSKLAEAFEEAQQEVK